MCTREEIQEIEAEYARAQAGDGAALLKLEIRAMHHLVNRVRRKFPRAPKEEVKDLLHDLIQDIRPKLSSYPHWRQALKALSLSLLRELRRRCRHRLRLLARVREPGSKWNPGKSLPSALPAADRERVWATLAAFEATLETQERLILRSRLYHEPESKDLPGLVSLSKASIKRRWKEIKGRLRSFLENV